MNKGLFTLSVLGGLFCAGGVAAGLYGTIEAEKEQKQIPEIRETIKQEYQKGVINTDEYTAEIEELATQDAELSAYKTLCIVAGVVNAIGVGVYTWAAVKNAEEL